MKRLFDPARGRGLKLFREVGNPRHAEFDPARGRGLKPFEAAPGRAPSAVRPRAGAWIETRLHHRKAFLRGRFDPARGRGLKRAGSAWLRPTAPFDPARGVD